MPKTMIEQRATWTKVAFGDVVQLSRERSNDPERDGHERFIGLEHIDPGDLRLRRWGNVADGVTFTSVFRPGQVLFGKRRAYQRKVAVADFSGVCSGDIYVLEPKGKALLPELLPFICQTEAFFEHAVGTSAGSLSPRTNWESLASFEFTLPPIEEQRRMASSLAACHALFSRYRDAVSNAAQVRDAMLIRLIGTSGLRPLDAVRDNWCYLPLGERYEVALGKMLSPKARLGDEQVPYLRNANVQWGRFDLSDVATMSIPPSERHRFLLKPGDVLACEGGNVGKSAIWNGEIPGACYQKALHRLRPLDPERDLPGFLLHCLRVYSLTGCLVEATAVTTIPHLPAERFREIVFPFPPRRVQEAVCAQVAKWNAGVDGIENRSSQIAAMAGELVRTLIP